MRKDPGHAGVAACMARSYSGGNQRDLTLLNHDKGWLLAKGVSVTPCALRVRAHHRREVLLVAYRALRVRGERLAYAYAYLYIIFIFIFIFYILYFIFCILYFIFIFHIMYV